MDRQQIGLKLVLDRLGLECKLDSFDNRLILQKAVYLAQAAGAKLGYFYQWYLYGPYSPSLTKDEYGVAMDIAQGMDDWRGWTLAAALQDALDRIRPLIQDGGRPDRRRLELLASVHFLIEHKRAPADSPEAMVDILRRYKKDFDTGEIAMAVRELQEYGLVKA